MMETAVEPVAEPKIGSQDHWKNLIDSDSDSDFGSNDGDRLKMDVSNLENIVKNDTLAVSGQEKEIGGSDSGKELMVERDLNLSDKDGSGSDEELFAQHKKLTNSKQSLGKHRDKKVILSSTDSDSDNKPLTGGTLKVTLERMDLEPNTLGTQKSNSSPKRWENLVDTDDEEEELLPIPEYYSSAHQSKGNGIQSDSNDSSVGKKSGSGNSKPKEKKLTKKQRDELRKEITSKTQKMIREAPLSLPYHKPKPQTLSEFLQRRSKTKAEFYTGSSESKTINLKKLGTPSSTMVNDWVSASAPEPIKVSPEKKYDDFTIEDFNLEDDEDAEVADNKIDSVKKNLFEDENGNDESQIKDLVQDMLNKVDEEVKKEVKESHVSPTPLPVVKTEKVFDIYDSEFDTDSELEEEFEIVDLTEKVDLKKPLPTISAADEEMELLITETDTSKENGVAVQPPPISETSALDDFQAKEDELNAYLKAAAKPKKLTLRERLLAMPNYQNITKSQPTIKLDTGSNGFINFTSNSKAKSSNVDNKIQALMDRYNKHTAVHKKPKEHHFTVQLSTKEEDSQGNQQVTLNEVDYVQRDEDETDELDNSPIRSTPGSKVDALRAKLEANIRAKKVKEYVEKLKLHAIYNDEKVLADKEEEEEELADEFSTESEPELTDEEMEAIQNARRKKKKKLKSAFIDEEAEDSDAENQIKENEDSDGDEDDVRPESAADNVSDNEMFIEKTYRRVQQVEDSSDEEEDLGQKVILKNLSPMTETVVKSIREDPDVEADTEESSDIPLSQDPGFELGENSKTSKQHSESDLFTDYELDLKSTQVETPCKTTFISDTQITPAQREIFKLVDSETPLLLPSETKDNTRESWKLPIVTNRHGRFSGGLSGLAPFLPRLDSDAALEALEEDMEHAQQDTPSANVSKEISKLFYEPTKGSPRLDDLMDLCSGKFPSQAPVTPAETQCTGFEFDTPTQTQTPVAKLSGKTVNRRLRETQETPKCNEKDKVNKTRLFMNTDNVQTQSEDNLTAGAGIILSDDEDQGSGIVVKQIKRKKRRLEFSDDEESETDTRISDAMSESESEAEAEASEKEYDSEENEIIVEKPKLTYKGLKSRAGQIRKEFVENEAELSGSEEGSGDEDERGLDELDLEEADAEEIDEENLRDELGRAHLKRLLDDDQRDIRYLQEALLEDGDLHGEGSERERQFKWKNMDSEMIDDNGRLDENVSVEVEDEAERLRQEEKAEKIKWMKENSHLIEDEEDEEVDSQKLFLEDSQYFRLGKSTLKKIQSSCSFLEASTSSNSCSQFAKITSTTVNIEKSTSKDVDSQGSVASGNKAKLSSQSFFASPDNPLLKMKRGSFLSRGATTLTKLAEMTKGSDSNSNVKNNSRNFVFAVVTPPAPDGSHNSEGNHSKASKKPAARQQNQKSTQPNKMPRIDRSFDSLDSTSKGASIFRHY